MRNPWFVLWEGPSALLPEVRVAVIGNPNSANRKVGGMLQVYVVPTEVRPSDNQDQGCCPSECPHSAAGGNGKRTCYVLPFQAPNTAHRMLTAPATLRGAAAWSAFKGHANRMPVRLTAYGDPMAMPPEILTKLLDASVCGYTAYTHAWKRKHAAQFAGRIQASVDSDAAMNAALRRGWKIFRTYTLGDSISKSAGELCANSRTGIQCDQCLACNGGSSIYIAMHGHGKNYTVDASSGTVVRQVNLTIGGAQMK